MRLADRLTAARHQRFVGRAEERELFRSALAAKETPFQILFVFGPGGVGKSALLGEFEQLCDQVGARALSIDARDVDPSPESFLAALGGALGLDRSESPLGALALSPTRIVVLIDTYETLTPLDGWLRDVFLPQASTNVLFVLAGREPPSPAWRTDPGWQSLVRTVPLRNLRPDEARTYLAQRGVPSDQHRSVLGFTHGHPLALSLVADAFVQTPDLEFSPEATPDVVRLLLAQFVEKVPSPAHRTAIESCALARTMTEPLLAQMLGTPEAGELFVWLRGLSFVQSGRVGLFPHDLAREALLADLRWRNREWYIELHRRARSYYLSRLHATQGDEQQRIVFDYIFLHRDNATIRPFFEWQETGTLLTDRIHESDVRQIVDMASRHEGKESAELAAYWARCQPQGFVVFRDVGQQPAGFVSTVALANLSSEDLAVDPAVRAAWGYLERHGPLRGSEAATLFRFWMASDTYQAVSPIQSLVFVHAVINYLSTPGLAFTFFPCADPDFWAAMFDYADLHRLLEADFEVGGRRYGVYGHDWRMVPPSAWQELLAAREVAAAAPGPPRGITPLLVLSEPEFGAAVRRALRDFGRSDALRANPLLRSRVIMESTGAEASDAEKTRALQELIREAIEPLARTRDAKLFRALDRTYLRAALTQERAAEALDLPFSTYRRHLTEGIKRVVDLLWQRETGEIPQE